MSVQWWETFGAVVYDRLKENDFKHIEDRLGQLDDRIGRVETRMTDRITGEIAGLEKRLDRVETRLSNRMEEGFRELKTLIKGTQGA